MSKRKTKTSKMLEALRVELDLLKATVAKCGARIEDVQCAIEALEALEEKPEDTDWQEV